MLYVILFICSIFATCNTVFAGTTHTVAQGDTLFGIARKYGVDRASIVEKNHIANGGIKIGQKLIIPDAVEKKPDQVVKKSENHIAKNKHADGAKKSIEQSSDGVVKEEKTHIVQTGETFAAISRKYNIKISELAAMNSCKVDHKVKIGEKVIVAKGSNEASKKPAEKHVTEKGVAKATKHVDVSSGTHSESENLCGIMLAAPLKQPNIVSENADGVMYQTESSTSVKASADGTVAFIGGGVEKYGEIIVLHHSNGILTIYGDLLEQNVKLGDAVKKHDVIGRTTDKLYFGVRKLKKPIDPKLCM